VFERFFGVRGEAGVDGGGLYDGAAGGHEPAETLAARQEADGARSAVASAHEAGGLQVGEHGGVIELRVERAQAPVVEVYTRVEEIRFGAVEHHARVDELPALDAGYHSQ